MATLRGGTFDKQATNAFYRLEALGTSKKSSELQHQSHSVATMEKRKGYLNDFKEYAKENFNREDGKLNDLMSKDNLKDFLRERLEGVSSNTAESYVSGFNSMMKGLTEHNITICEGGINSMSEIRAEIKENYRESEIQNRYVQDSEHIKADLSHSSSIVATLQHEAGFRASEALEIARNPEKYLRDDNNAYNVAGKGGQHYQPKELSSDLAARLRDNTQEIPTYKQYQQELKEYSINSHDFRFTYARNEYEKLTNEEGLTHKEALKSISEEMNHHRESTTEHYLART